MVRVLDIGAHSSAAFGHGRQHMDKQSIEFLLNTPDTVDGASSSTRTDSEPFAELLTAAHMLDHSRRDSSKYRGHDESQTYSQSSMEGSQSSDKHDKSQKKRKKRPSVPCEVCGRMFGEAAAVRKHQRVVHMKVKDFACDICDRKFAEKSNLKKHVQARHEQSRSHKCQYCDKVFNFTDGLRRHVNNCHLGLRPYECEDCQARFKQRTHLQKHRQSVHGVQPPAKRREDAMQIDVKGYGT